MHGGVRLLIAAVAVCAACKHHPTAFDIDFDSKVHLTGARIDPPKAKRGEHVTIHLEWRCDVPPGAGWRLLTHAADSSGKADNLDFLHELPAPEHWEAGKTYNEALDYEIPSWATNHLTVYVGLFNGPKRMHVVAGPSDGKDRGVAGEVTIE